MSVGYVYIMVNNLDTGKVKIGFTNDVDRRMTQHNAGSGSIGAWVLQACAHVTDMEFVERNMHHAFSEHVVSGRREQFTINVVDAVAKLATYESIDPIVDVFDALGKKAASAKKTAENLAKLHARQETERRIEASYARNAEKSVVAKANYVVNAEVCDVDSESKSSVSSFLVFVIFSISVIYSYMQVGPY